MKKASSHGLVVKVEDSWPRGPGFKPPLQRPFFRHHSFRSKLWTKIVETLTWHYCMCCNHANGRVDFEEWSAHKIQLHGIEWIVSLSADWDQSPKKTKKKYSFENSKLIFVDITYNNLFQTDTNADLACLPGVDRLLTGFVEAMASMCFF
jgi:hypothetical protein